MAEVKRITIPVDSELKDRLELIAKNQRRSLSANLEHALEVYSCLFDEHGKMLVPIDSILMGDLSSLRNINTVPYVPIKENMDKQVDKTEGLGEEEVIQVKEVQKQVKAPKEEEADLNDLLKNMDEDIEVPEL